MIKWLFILVMAVVFSGCCQGECITCGPYASFESFSETEADTVLIVEYATGTAQTTIRDSQWMYKATLPTDTTRATLYKDLFCGSDWKIFIPALNRQYLITDIQTERRKCACDPGKQQFMKAYFVNGVRHEERTLVLQ